MMDDEDVDDIFRRSQKNGPKKAMVFFIDLLRDDEIMHFRHFSTNMVIFEGIYDLPQDRP